MEDQAEVIKDVVGSLKDVASALKEKKSEDKDGLNLQVVLQAMQASSEVKAELSAIKTLLLANLVRSGGSTNGSVLENGADMSQLIASLASPEKHNALSSILSPVPAPVTTPAKAEPEPTPEEIEAKKRTEGITRAREALGEMVKQCGAELDETLAAGSGLLIMFLRNILKDPLNPRYRRVARTNANFKKSLEPLAGYLNFFDAVGFEERGSQMELKTEWVESLEKDTADVTGWAKAVIEDAISNLETVREQRSPYAPTGSGVSSTSPPLKPKAAKWEPPAPSPVRPNSVSSQPISFEPVQNPVPPPPSSSSNPASVPSYPLSFAEVAKMHAEGKRPDGIKDIPDKLSSDEPSKPTMAPPTKPWEKVNPSSPSASPNRLHQLGQPNRSKVEIVQLNDENGDNGSVDTHEAADD